MASSVPEKLLENKILAPKLCPVDLRMHLGGLASTGVALNYWEQLKWLLSFFGALQILCMYP